MGEDGICSGNTGGGSEYVPVEDIIFPGLSRDEFGNYLVRLGDVISLSNVSIYPENATYSNITLSVEGADYNVEEGTVSFKQPVSQATIYATIESDNGAQSFKFVFNIIGESGGGGECPAGTTSNGNGMCLCPDNTPINSDGSCNGDEPGYSFVPVQDIYLDGIPQSIQTPVGTIVSTEKAQVLPYEATYNRINWSATGVAELILNPNTNTYDISFPREGQARITATVTCGLASNEEMGICENYTKFWNVRVGQGTGNECPAGATLNNNGMCICENGNPPSADGSCSGTGGYEFIPVANINIDLPIDATTNSYSIKVGEEFYLSKVSVYPEDATYRNIEWEVSGVEYSGFAYDCCVGCVCDGSSGVVFEQAGLATITATIRNGRAPATEMSSGQDYTQTFYVNVIGDDKPTFVAVESIGGVQFPQQVELGTIIPLNNASVLPQNATNQEIIWNSEGATIQANTDGSTNVIFDRSVSVATITAVVKGGAVDLNGNQQDFIYAWKIMVNVEDPIENEPEFFAVSEIQLNITTQVTEGDVIQLANAKVLPANATNNQITWNVSGNAELTDGLLTLTAAGEATITAVVECGISGTKEEANCMDFSKNWTIKIAEKPAPVPEFVAVDTIQAYFPKFVAKGDLIYLGAESALPKNANNRSIVWSVENATLNGSAITFNMGGIAKIIATIANGKAESEAYTQTWEVSVSAPVQYIITVNIPGVEPKPYSYEADEQVTVLANMAPNGQEFERWKVTSNNKPVTLNSVDLSRPILSLVMPKINLEVTAIYKPVAQPPKYEVAVIGGSVEGESSYAVGEEVSITLNEALIPAGYEFGYWTVFPADVNINIKEANINFEMPQTDVMLRAVYSKVETDEAGKTIEIADIVKSANVEDWASTIIGESEIAVKKEEDGSIAITANVGQDGFAAIETDIAMKNDAANNDSVHVSYSSNSEWRLYLDIPGIPYAEGYFVTLPANASQPVLKKFLYSMVSAFAADTDGSKSYSLSDFKNALGEPISLEFAQKSTGMSFAPTTEGEASLTITDLNIVSILEDGNEEIDNGNEPILVQANQRFFAINVANNAILFDVPSDAFVGVYNLKGSRIYTGMGANRIPVASGAYIVRIKAPGINYNKTISVR